MTKAATTTPATCGRCGRALRTAASIAAGVGPVCAAKLAEGAATVAASDTQIEQAVELIEDGALVRWTRGLYLAVSSDGSVYYEVMPAAGTHGACSCRAGQYGRRCYHLLAAELIGAERPSVVAARIAAVALRQPADPFAAFTAAA